jgi:hypothetical protein
MGGTQLRRPTLIAVMCVLILTVGLAALAGRYSGEDSGTGNLTNPTQPATLAPSATPEVVPPFFNDPSGENPESGTPEDMPPFFNEPSGEAPTGAPPTPSSSPDVPTPSATPGNLPPLF